MNDGEKHINLFEEQERLLQNKDMAELKRLKEEEFLKGKNVDYSTRFLGSFVNSLSPWYSKKKGTVQERPRNKHYKHLDDVIYGTKTDSRVTKEVIETEKREEQRNREEALRDRTREKIYGKYEEYDQKRTRLDKPQSKPSQDLRKYEEDMLVKEFKSSKEEEL